MRESTGPADGARLGMALAAMVAACPAVAVAKCDTLVPGTTLDMPASLTLACGTARCRVSVSGRTLAEVALATGPKVCDSTGLHVEDGLPPACDHALSRTGLSLRQTVPAKGGPLDSQVVVDVLGEAAGIPWQGSKASIRACLPRYAGKRGDVWQYTWRGEADSVVYQVFEEDEAPSGHGSGNPRASKPPSLVLSVSGTRPAAPVAGNRPAPRPATPSPGRPAAAPDVDRF